MSTRANTEAEIEHALQSWVPRRWRRQLQMDPLNPRKGSTELVCHDLIVEVTTYLGDDRCKPFTRLDTFHAGRKWSVAFDRSYDPHWWPRLANRFARAVLQQTKS
jgi:hypothetical protein